MGSYAEKRCYSLGKLPYGSLVGGAKAAAAKKKKKRKRGKQGKQPQARAITGNYDKGVMFATYSTLIGKSRGSTRLDQLIECESRRPSSTACARRAPAHLSVARVRRRRQPRGLRRPDHASLGRFAAVRALTS